MFQIFDMITVIINHDDGYAWLSGSKNRSILHQTKTSHYIILTYLQFTLRSLA